MVLTDEMDRDSSLFWWIVLENNIAPTGRQMEGGLPVEAIRGGRGRGMTTLWFILFFLTAPCMGKKG